MELQTVINLINLLIFTCLFLEMRKQKSEYEKGFERVSGVIIKELERNLNQAIKILEDKHSIKSNK